MNTQTQRNLVQWLRTLEWSSAITNESGHGVPCCPVCYRLKPGTGRTSGLCTAEGHKLGCHMDWWLTRLEDGLADCPAQTL